MRLHGTFHRRSVAWSFDFRKPPAPSRVALPGQSALNRCTMAVYYKSIFSASMLK
jgi:hypothetical protein